MLTTDLCGAEPAPAAMRAHASARDAHSSAAAHAPTLAAFWAARSIDALAHAEGMPSARSSDSSAFTSSRIASTIWLRAPAAVRMRSVRRPICF
eukprot:3547391-Prymnesium_polylepis.1